MAFKLKSGNTTPFKQLGSSPAKHKPKSSGTWDAKFGTKPEKDTHKHPHTKEVQATADWHEKGDPRYKDAKSGYERAMSKGPRKNLALTMDMHTRNEKRSLSDAEANPEYFKPEKKENIKNPKYKKKSPAKDMKTGSYEHSFESPAKQKTPRSDKTYGEKVPTKSSPGYNTKKPNIKLMSKTGGAEAASEAITQAQINKLKKAKGKKVDPDAPGTPGTPGYEPPVKREDLDEAGKKRWDELRAKKKKK